LILIINSLTEGEGFGIKHVSSARAEGLAEKIAGEEKKLQKVVDGCKKIEYSAESVAAKSGSLGL